MNYAENIEYLKTQLAQTQLWIENGSEFRSDNVITMIIKDMIETERQIEVFEEMNKKALEA